MKTIFAAILFAVGCAESFDSIAQESKEPQQQAYELIITSTGADPQTVNCQQYGDWYGCCVKSGPCTQCCACNEIWGCDCHTSGTGC